MKLLIIDDNEVNLKILNMILSSDDYDIKTLTSCDNLQSKLNSDIDLVLITNKFMSFINEINKIPVVVVSMRASIDEVVSAYAEGISDYIILPSSPTGIKMRVKSALTEKRNLDDILNAIRPVQAKDNSSYKHLERIKSYAKILALELKNISDKFKIDDDFIKNLELASTLHDIGKTWIADKILKKPDKLSDEEFEDIKTHTTLGFNVLDKIKNTPFVEMAKEIVLSHHERYDGTGYPYNKIGDEIPLSAKIIALCDVYDALRETRTYKETFSHEKSVDIIKGNSKKHFDPLIVEAFEKIQHEFDEIFNRLSLMH